MPHQPPFAALNPAPLLSIKNPLRRFVEMRYKSLRVKFLPAYRTRDPVNVEAIASNEGPDIFYNSH